MPLNIRQGDHGEITAPVYTAVTHPPSPPVHSGAGFKLWLLCRRVDAARAAAADAYYSQFSFRPRLCSRSLQLARQVHDMALCYYGSIMYATAFFLEAVEEGSECVESAKRKLMPFACWAGVLPHTLFRETVHHTSM